jgi:ADP-dependent NAD(P)H-hydrate dehydratase / NAD(P)H-hydrate epimerase
MKILTAEQTKAADDFTIKNKPISSLNLMERAGTNCTSWIIDNYTTDIPVIIFCGIGNNGGDGLVIARLLKKKGFDVSIYIVEFSKKYSPDFSKNLKKLEKEKVNIHFLTENNFSFELPENILIIDAIFGNGLSKPINGFIAEIITTINTSNTTVIAIDIPSGLFADSNINNNSAAIIEADYTLTIQQPKQSFFAVETQKYVGKFIIINIGILPAFLNEVVTDTYFVTHEAILPLLKKRTKFSHKGTYGHSLIIAGSKGKMGAAVLASRACLKIGSGLVTALVPRIGLNVVQIANPEVMCIATSEKDFINELPDLSNYNSIGVGPGIGTEKQTQNSIKLLIQNCKQALVLDADALNILAENKTWLAFLPPHTILTPHPKEFERLVGKTSNSEEKWQLQKKFAIKHQVIVVLKGAYTSIACPTGELYFNSTGNPGMATAGSGDVLTGIITGLLAQGYTPSQAAILGVYVHGFAGDKAKEILSENTLVASDIINNLYQFF